MFLTKKYYFNSKFNLNLKFNIIYRKGLKVIQITYLFKKIFRENKYNKI